MKLKTLTSHLRFWESADLASIEWCAHIIDCPHFWIRVCHWIPGRWDVFCGRWRVYQKARHPPHTNTVSQWPRRCILIAIRFREWQWEVVCLFDLCQLPQWMWPLLYDCDVWDLDVEGTLVFVPPCMGLCHVTLLHFVRNKNKCIIDPESQMLPTVLSFFSIVDNFSCLFLCAVFCLCQARRCNVAVLKRRKRNTALHKKILIWRDENVVVMSSWLAQKIRALPFLYEAKKINSRLYEIKSKRRFGSRLGFSSCHRG